MLFAARYFVGKFKQHVIQKDDQIVEMLSL